MGTEFVLMFCFSVFLYCWPRFQSHAASTAIILIIHQIIFALYIWSYLRTHLTDPGYIPDDIETVSNLVLTHFEVFSSIKLMFFSAK